MAKINPNINKNKNERLISDMDQFVQMIKSGDRVALGKAITLIESESSEDEKKAHKLLSSVLKHHEPSFRIGISGAPGAGKSTLIEALGLYLVEKGYKPAVLAIDPSSSVTRGSILGDKTRMTLLSRKNEAFIRPSPAGKTLGGVARKTRESILLLETAGYNPILVETVGVGQSETTVKSITDLFVLLIAPGAGDEIQGIKRGIMELADIILVNKMDGQLENQAKETLQHYQQATMLLAQDDHWTSRIMGISALNAEGIDSLWQSIEDFKSLSIKSGYLTSKREEQNTKWFEDHIRSGFFEQLLKNPKLGDHYNQLKEQVRLNKITPFAAASKFLQMMHNYNG